MIKKKDLKHGQWTAHNGSDNDGDDKDDSDDGENQETRTKSQCFVIIWENNLLKVAVQSFLSSLSLNSGKINVPELICNHEAFS